MMIAFRAKAFINTMLKQHNKSNSCHDGVAVTANSSLQSSGLQVDSILVTDG